MRLLTTQQVAERLQMSTEWVRDHRFDLGATRLGNERNGALRFDERGIEAYVLGRRLKQPGRPARKGGRPRGIQAIPADVSAW